MQVSVEHIQGLERKLKISLPVDDYKKEVDKKLNELKRKVNLPGFRPGKVPLSVVKKRFGDAARAEVMDNMINQSYPKALEQHDIVPVASPKIENIHDDENALSYDAIIEVYPEIPEIDYSSIQVKQARVVISSEDVDNTIKELRARHKKYNDVTREARELDLVIVSYVVTIDGKELPGWKINDRKFIIGKKMTGEVEDGIKGMKAGDNRKLEHKFPADHHDDDVAGKDVVFDVILNKVQEPVLPELNEEFFKEFGVTEGGEQAFRDQVRKNLEREYADYQRSFLKNQIIFRLNKQYRDLEIPRALIEQEKERLLQDLRQNPLNPFGNDFSRYDLDKSQYLAAEAENRVRAGLVIAKLIEKENIKVENDELEQHIEAESLTYEDPEQFKNHYLGNERAFKNLLPTLVEEKAIKFIAAQGKIENVDMKFDELVKKANATLEDE